WRVMGRRPRVSCDRRASHSPSHTQPPDRLDCLPSPSYAVAPSQPRARERTHERPRQYRRERWETGNDPSQLTRAVGLKPLPPASYAAPPSRARPRERPPESPRQYRRERWEKGNDPSQLTRAVGLKPLPPACASDWWRADAFPPVP